MTAAVQAWHDPVSGSSMDEIEEGLLDETDNTLWKIHEKSTAFSKSTEYGWKELVSDPSIGDVDLLENSKTGRQDNNFEEGGISCKDWDQYLSALSLDDDTEFMPLGVHTDRGRSKVKENEFSKSMTEASTVAGEKNIVTTQGHPSQQMVEQGSLSTNRSFNSEHGTFPTTSKSAPRQNLAWSTKEYSPDGANLYGTSKTDARPGSAPVTGSGGINSQPGLISGSDMMATSDTGHGSEEASKLIRRPNSVPSRTSVGVDWQSLIPMDKNYPPMSNTNLHWQTETMKPPISATDTSNSSRNFSSTNSGVISNIDGGSSERKTRETRPKSALDGHSVAMNSYFPKHSSSVPRASSAPLWQDAEMNKQAANLFDHSGHIRLNKAAKIDDLESSLEERKISGADDDMLHKSRVFSKTSSAVTRNPTGSDGENTRVVQKRSAEYVPSDAQTSTTTNSSFVRETTGRSTEKIIMGKKNISVDHFTHSPGDGMHGQISEYVMKGNSDSLTKLKETNNGETKLELKRLRDDDSHSVAGNVSEICDNNEGTNSAILADLRLSTNSASSDTQQLSTINTLDFEKTTPEISNIAPSREAAENLPVRPLTIGNSLTIGSTPAYRPVSPFQPDLYPTGTASIPMVPPTTSAVATYLSPSQYSEGMLDEEEERGGDMSAVERLQPLGRDGLEVKQGPPWGITMPLFQPNSRNSSLSSNDSNLSSASNSQFVQLQTMSSQPSNLEIEPQQSVSSTPSETDLSRKASIKSLEPKEPMGVKTINGAENLKTPIGKFRQNHNNVDGDSPVSKILGPTFKATQKMLEELQRMPLGAYDEDLEQPPVEKNATEATTNKYESETSSETGTVVSDRGLGSGGYAGLEGDVRNESSRVEGNRSTQDGRRAQESRHSHDSRPSSREMIEPTRDSYHNVSINQRTPDLSPRMTAHLGVVSNTHSSVLDDHQIIQHSKLSGEKETENPARGSFHEDFIDQRIIDLTPKTTANIGLANNTRSPVVSRNVSDPQNITHGYVGSHSWRNENHKTSGLTDSTLENSIGLSDHLLPAEVEANNEGAAIGNVDPKSLVFENRNDASDMSEFDRVASESISRSNTVANQFREEMKFVNLEVQGGFQTREDDQTLVDEPGTTTPILDSGLSESTTNDEIYRPKGLARLSAGNGPIGMYDIRQSSGPGSTNRKRLALGRKPRESSYSLQMGDIYVSDGTTGTSGTDRASKRKSRQSRHTKDSRVHGGVYVSEGTTSGTEAGYHGIDSEPEGQSTPRSDDGNAKENNGLTTSMPELSAKENGKPMTDMYLGLSNFEFEKPRRESRSSFTAYEIGKPTRFTPPAFTNYKSERISREDPSAFSTFEIGKPMRVDPAGALRNGSVTGGNVLGTNFLASSQKGSNVMRLQSTAKVEHTWSISKPVMSQLSTRVAPLVIPKVDQKPKDTTKQQPLERTEQRTTRPPDHRRKRVPRPKDTVPRPVRQHVRGQSSESMESEKTPDRSGKTRTKKSVADIILENMIHEEQEQKKRHKKLEVKQVQTTQDLNQLWERFQEVVGKKSRPSRRSRQNRVLHSRPSREIISTDVSVVPSSDSQFTEKRRSDGRSIDISTDSDEEFKRFLRRIREIQSSGSTSYLEEDGSMISRPSSSKKRATHDHSESGTTPNERMQCKPRQKVVDSSTSMSSISPPDDRRHVSRSRSEVPSVERLPRKASLQTVDSSVVVSSSGTERKYEVPVALPMWLGVKNRETMKKGKTSSTCTCGAKSRKEKLNTSGVRDIGVNCPTPPLVGQELMPVATDIAVLKAGQFKEDIVHPAPASLVKLTLQDAFMYSKQEFIERSLERVKKVKEKHEERKTVKTSNAHVIVVPSGKPKKENRKPEQVDRLSDMKPNKELEQLQRKKPRPMTTKEIRDVNKRMYKNLPEVRKRKDEERRAEMYKTNRLRAQLYGKHVRNTNRIFTAA